MTVALLTRALDAETPADDSTSERILDAALAIAAASGLRHLTMDDVARRAGVGRMTVYRRFSTREALIDALGGREARRCLAELDAASPVDAPFEEQVTAGFMVAMRLISDHPLLSRLARVEPEQVLEAFTADDSALLRLGTAYLAGRLRRTQAAGVEIAGDADELSEVLVRLALSFVVFPATDLPLDDPELARRLFLPLLQPT